MAKVKQLIYDIEFKVGDSKSRLDGLASRLDKATKAFNKAEEGTAEYIRAQNELKQINSEIDGSFVKNEQAVSNYDRTMRKATNGLRNFLAIGSATAILKDGINKIIDFDDALKDLSAITGATGGDLEFFEQQAKQIGATSTVSATKAVEAFKLIGSQSPELLKSSSALAEVTDSAIILAEASRLTLPEAAGALTTAMNQFNIPANESKQIIDAFAAGAVKGAADIPKLTDTIERSGTVLSQNNVTFGEAIALSETLATKQLVGAEAGTALRSVILRLVKDGKGFVDGQFNIVEALEQTKAEFNAIQDPVKRANAEFALFQEGGITAGGILLENIDKLKEFKIAVEESGTAQQQANTNNESVRQSLTRVANAYETMILSFSKSSGRLARILTFVADNFTTITKAVGAGIVTWTAYRVILAIINRAKLIYAARARAAATGTTLFSQATKIGAFNMKIFNRTIAVNPVGLLLTALSTAAVFMLDFADATDEATEQDLEFQKQINQTIASLKARNEVIGKIDTNIAQTSIQELRDEINSLNEDLTNLSADNLDERVDRSIFELQEDLQTSDGFFEDFSFSTDPVLRRYEEALGELEKDIRFSEREFNKALNENRIDEFENAQSKRLVEIIGVGITEDRKRLEEELKKREQELAGGSTSTTTNTSVNVARDRNDSLLREQERHALAVAKFEKASEEEILAIKIDFAQKQLEELEASGKAKESSLLRQNNIISELNRQLADTSSLNDLKEEIDSLKESLISGEIPLSSNYEDTLERFILKTRELKTAQGEAFENNETSVKALQDRARQLEELAQKANQGTKAFDELKVALIEAQKELEAAQNALKPIDFRALNAEALNEQERHQIEMARIREEGEIRRLNIQIDFAKARLKILAQFNELETQEAKNLNNKIEELEAEKAAVKDANAQDEVASEKEKTQAILSGIEEVLQATIQAVNTLIEIKKQEVEQLIGLQQGRVAEAQEIADQGNAELLQAEEERLDELNRQREDYVRKQQALAAIQLVAESALAIAKAAAAGGPAAPFTIAATIIALAAGIAQARAVASQAAFFKGGYTGDGNPYQESQNLGSRPYIYHKKEFVMDHVSTGIGNNRKHFQEILDKRINLDDVFASQNAIIIENQNGYSDDVLKKIESAIKDQIDPSLIMNDKGIVHLYDTRKKRRDKLKRRLS